MTVEATKTRSPNYPAINLADAISRVRVIYDKQHTYPATREVLAKLLGYGGLNGASQSVISALSKYGLLEGRGEQLRVSSTALDLIQQRKGAPEYLDALQRAAFMPTLFRELRDQYPDRLPSEHSLRASLERRGFSRKAADGALRVYRDTLEFVDAEGADFNEESIEDSRPEAPMQGQPPGQTHPLAGSVPWARYAATTLAPELGPSPLPSSDPALRSVQLPLSRPEWAMLQVPYPLNEADWDMMMAVLTAMKPALVPPAERQASGQSTQEQTDEPAAT